MRVTLQINGHRVEREVPVNESLLAFLRGAGFWSVKHGCETGECGACTILLDGRPVCSCLLLAAQAEGRAVTTLEGLGSRETPHPLQQAFVEQGAIQCGYCTPAMIVVAHALLKENPHPDERAIREALAGVLCRCTGYLKPVEAVRAVTEG